MNIKELTLIELIQLSNYAKSEMERLEKEMKLYPKNIGEEIDFSNHWFEVNESCEIELLEKTGYIFTFL
jgi:hypothetical protein